MLVTFARLSAGGLIAATLALTLPLADASKADATDGIVHVKSSYGMAETIEHIKASVAEKGIMFFQEIDQSGLAAKSGVKLNPSTLLVFGNPPLGTLFLSANPDSGLDWPVSLLVRQDDNGVVWAVYTDFPWIARRHHIKNREAEFAKATTVIQSITSSVGRR